MKRISSVVLFFSLGLILSASTDCKKGSMPDTTLNKQLIKITPFRLLLLPPSSGIQFYRNGIVFLSSTKYEEKMVPDYLSFGNVNAYIASVQNSVLGSHSLFSRTASFEYPCDAVSFSSDYNNMYFTKLSDEEGVEKIYKAVYTPETGSPGKWITDDQPQPFCIGKSNYTHPALSADGKIIIFASDNRASLGGFDLFLTRKEGGKWSEPVNLGETINTKSDELFPFLDSRNNLYFSSDGLKGYGGYDIYVCKFAGGTWGNPINLIKPVNTVDDDIAFTVNPNDGKSAFYTVKQRSRKRSMQLYMVTINSSNAPGNLTDLSEIFIPPDRSEIKLPEKITASVNESEKKLRVNTETKSEVVPAQKTQAVPDEPSVKKDVVVYRVQFISNSSPKGSYKITLNSKVYSTYEYLYKGGYRTCVGEFNTLAPAKDLQNMLRKTGYPQAFVVVFKNNERSTDPMLFK